MKKYPIGIDLGTTYSCMAVWKDSGVEILTNEQGNRTTPSCVSFLNGEMLVGDLAKNLMITNSKNTIFESKRLIGKSFDDPVVQNDLMYWPYKIININNKPLFEIDDKNYHPEQIAGFI